MTCSEEMLEMVVRASLLRSRKDKEILGGNGSEAMAKKRDKKREQICGAEITLSLNIQKYEEK